VNKPYNYKAFISYSHRDEKWAAWLHRALEAYRLPRKLAGSGKIPARIKPVFRDRDELSSSADLGGTVQRALEASENLIVVCSPAATASHWVNQEIRHFAGFGRRERIFCVIVDGDPAAIEAGSGCFPPALAEIGMHEPLAADVRRWADGKHLAKLKLVAGMLGLPLDRLRRRDLQKRQKVWAIAAVAGVALAAVLVTAITARIAAQQRRDSGESLVAYKLNELRTLLNVATDPGELDRLKAWDQERLARLIDDAGEQDNALTTYAMQLRERGIGVWRGDDLAQAMEAFQDSWALLAEAYRRDKSDLATFFELGQAEFWIGQVYRDLGALETAEEALITYAEITRQLIVQQPENAEWVLEMAFALSNLGSVQRNLDADNPARALQLLQSALEYNQIALVLDPANEYYKSELGQSHAFLADAQRDVCDLEGAYQSRQKQLDLEQELLANDQDDIDKMRHLAFALSGVAVVQEDLGLVTQAEENYENALKLMAVVAMQSPGVRAIERFMLDRRHHVAMLMAHRGDLENAWMVLDELEKEWQGFLKADGEQDENTEAYVIFLISRARLALEKGVTGMALRLLEDASARTIKTLEKLPRDRDAGNMLVKTAYMQWEINQALPAQHVMAFLPEYRTNPGRTRACLDASLAAKKAVMLGDTTRAVEWTNYLLDRDYTEMSFIQFCEKHGLCERR
jgi:tetratricopeptide (TPR) repeat protein